MGAAEGLRYAYWRYLAPAKCTLAVASATVQTQAPFTLFTLSGAFASLRVGECALRRNFLQGEVSDYEQLSDGRAPGHSPCVRRSFCKVCMKSRRMRWRDCLRTVIYALDAGRVVASDIRALQHGG